MFLSSVVNYGGDRSSASEFFREIELLSSDSQSVYQSTWVSVSKSQEEPS